MECTSSWKSVLVNLPLVRELIADEVAAGFIQSIYFKTAVGKLGIVIAEGRLPGGALYKC